MLKRSVVVRGLKTSISLEDEFFSALQEIARDTDQTVNDIVNAIDFDRQEKRANLSSCTRIYIINYFREKMMLANRDDNF